MLSALAASLALVALDTPPLLSSPVFSLSTLGADGQTTMNILTYATPVGIKPHRLWAISLFRETQSHANWQSRGTGVLQQLSAEHGPLMHTLGGTSSVKADVDKAAACEALGWEWFESEECGAERLLPGCVTYSRLVQQGELIDAGNHEVAICRLERVFGPGEAEGQASAGLNTAELREAGLITAAGRAVEPAS
jgi:flavin reductase (DIM6/NTAB) family NADH-FMN oxidoreductase RutF|eukprot:Transcript_10238.p2 GENE.Transcript_10238~~Transcript_10238.p2  ORF type:complete len:194 (+),score=65.48 Transcript_10238:154-735(+)